MIFFSKVKEIPPKYAQALFVSFTFALMVLSSYFFLSDTERSHLRKDAENAILFAEANIKSELLEPETLLEGISTTIREMILRNDTIEEIHRYISNANSYLQYETEERMIEVIELFAFFDVFDGKFISDTRGRELPEDYDPASRPWYEAALKANGRIGVSQPFVDVTKEVSITFTRRIFDNDGNPLAVVGLDILLDKMMQYAVDTRFTEQGYGFLLCEDLRLIAHPDLSLLDIPITEINSGIGVYINESLQTGIFSEFVTTNVYGDKTIVFCQRIYNGWYMGIATPRNSYFRSTRTMMIVLVSLGVFFASLLIFMLLRINKERSSSDERMRIMFDTNPISATFWSNDLGVIDCNENALKMFELQSKKEYNDKFFELSPEYQPDGSRSREKSREYLKKALDEGICRFDWMHQTLSKELIPCEVTLVRVKYNNELIAVGYARDLREQKQLMMVSEQQTRLLDTVHTAAAILLANNDMNAFKNSLLKCFDLIGHCLDLDRVQIWQNEERKSETHFVLKYQWTSESEQKAPQRGVNSSFPLSSIPDWEEKFFRGEYVSGPIDTLSPEAQEFLGKRGIKSIVMIPLFLENVLWGCFCLDDCRSARSFSFEEISILTSAGLMMSSVINRNIQTLKMREEEERTQIMIDTAPICAIFWDNNLKLIDCNQEAVRMFGMAGKQEFIEKFVSLSPAYQPDGVSSREKGGRLVKKALDEGYSRFEWIHQKLNGEQIPAEITCIRVKHKEVFTVIEYIRDLREQKAMIAEMRKAEIAEESSKAKSDFLAKMSHEIRTPMNAILGITEIQLNDQTHPKVTREAFERIYNSGGLLLGIINDILDLSRIEAGKLILIPAQYEIASLIHDTIQLNIMRYESKPIEFILDVSEDLPSIMIGDELRIKQILNNILSNAFKYTNEGRVTLKVFAEPVSPDEITKRMLVFVVNDTGQGMTAEQIKRLGTEYSRFNMEANRKTEGTGLGMSITQNLIHLMKGSLDIESTPGLGSTFTVHFPQDCVGTSVLGKEMADNLMQLNIEKTMSIKTMQLKRDFMPYGRVLVVDDVETNLYVAKGLMAPYGLSIDTVSSGFEAVDKIRDGFDYDIIFMDHMMPRMDGIEATKLIRSLGYKKPIVALTANALAGQAEMFLQNGFDDFISKPIDIRQLNLTLNKLVRDKYPSEVIDAAKKQKEDLFSGSGYKNIDPQLAEFFIRDARKAITILETIYNNKCRRGDDVSLLIVNVHAMKSALANIGESALASEAARIEKAGREQNIKQVLADLPSFLELLYAVIGRLEPKEEVQARIDDESNKEFLKEKLLAIKESCTSLDKKTAKDILAQARQKTWSTEVKEMLSNISENLLHSEFDEVTKIIDGYVKQP